MTFHHWTAENDQYLLDNRGLLSAAQIGNHIGVTRNAVVGRVHRLGLPKIKHAIPGGKPRKPRLHRLGESKKRAEPRQEVLPPPMPVEPLNILFGDLQPQHCREIVGSAGIGMSLSCGHPVIHESSYCRWHHSINHTVAAPRTKRQFRFAA